MSLKYVYASRAVTKQVHVCQSESHSVLQICDLRQCKAIIGERRSLRAGIAKLQGISSNEPHAESSKNSLLL